MTWRVLWDSGTTSDGGDDDDGSDGEDKEISIVCVLSPSMKWWKPRLSGKVGRWNGEEMIDGSLLDFDLRVRHVATGRFRVDDKVGTISGTADAPSGGVALLAVLLCALEGGCGMDMKFSELSWQGGQLANGLIAIH